MNIKSNILNKRQQGMALVMSLIMLLLVTILGVSAVRMSNLDTQVAGNSIYTALAFQTAESAIGKSAIPQNIVTPASNRGVASAIVVGDEMINGGASLTSDSQVIFDGVLDAPVLNSVANSSEFNYQVFRFSAEGKLAGTAVKDRHTEARAAQIPKQ